MLSKILAAWFISLVSWVIGFVKQVKSCYDIAAYAVMQHGKLGAFGAVHRLQAGAVDVQLIIMVFVGIVIVYQLIQQVSGQNVLVQASANVTTMGKFAAGLGEWLFPLLGIIALVMLLFRRKAGGKGT